MTIHERAGIRIRTTHDYEGYCAVDDDTYDADCDQDGFFSTSLVGHGPTEDDAIDDLLAQMDSECVGEPERPCQTEARWDHDRDARKHG